MTAAKCFGFAAIANRSERSGARTSRRAAVCRRQSGQVGVRCQAARSPRRSLRGAAACSSMAQASPTRTTPIERHRRCRGFSLSAASPPGGLGRRSSTQSNVLRGLVTNSTGRSVVCRVCVSLTVRGRRAAGRSHSPSPFPACTTLWPHCRRLIDRRRSNPTRLLGCCCRWPSAG